MSEPSGLATEASREQVSEPPSSSSGGTPPESTKQGTVPPEEAVCTSVPAESPEKHPPSDQNNAATVGVSAPATYPGQSEESTDVDPQVQAAIEVRKQFTDSKTAKLLPENPSRRLLKRGQVRRQATLSIVTRELFLFDDCIVLAKAHEIKWVLPLDTIMIEHQLTESGKLPFPFTISAGKDLHTMSVSSAAERASWTYEITRAIAQCLYKKAASADGVLEAGQTETKSSCLGSLLPSQQAADQRQTGGVDVELLHKVLRGSLHSVVADNAVEPARKLLSEKDVDVNEMAFDGNTALHYAARYSSVEITKLLLEAKADPSIPNQYGYTPIHIAATTGRSEILKALLSHLISNAKTPSECIDVIEAPTKDGLRPLALSVATRNISEAATCTTLLLQARANPNQRNHSASTHLISCARSPERASVIWALLAGGASASLSGPEEGRVALHYAVEADNIEAVKYLLQLGASPNSRDWTNQVPMHFARSEIVASLLVSYGARYDLVSSDGYDAITKFQSNLRILPQQAEAVRRRLDEASRKWRDHSQPVPGDRPPMSETSELWMQNHESDVCVACGERFGILTWRHHCRRCGMLVCSACSSKRFTYHSTADEKHRCCDGCFNYMYTKYTNPTFKSPNPSPNASALTDAEAPRPSSPTSTSSLSSLSEDGTSPRPSEIQRPSTSQTSAPKSERDQQVEATIRSLLKANKQASKNIERLHELDDRARSVETRANQFSDRAARLREKFKKDAESGWF